MNYDVDYYIEKFKAIPVENWITGDFYDGDNPVRRCAMGHCLQEQPSFDTCMNLFDSKHNLEGYSLHQLFIDHGFTVGLVNDNETRDHPSPLTKRSKVVPRIHRYIDNPRDRILAVLYYIKAKQDRGRVMNTMVIAEESE